MKKAILILLTVLLAVSCSQVVYDKLPPEDIEEYSATFETERVNKPGDSDNSDYSADYILKRHFIFFRWRDRRRILDR